MARILELSNPPLHGGDVIALQTALKAASIYKGQVDEAYVDELGHTRYHGPGYSGAVAHASETAKFRLGFSKSQIHPQRETAGAQLTALLQGHAKLSTAQKIRRRKRLNVPTVEQAKRAKVVEYWNSFLLPKAAEIHYAERRPIDGLNDLERLPSYQDCSGTVTKACRYGGFNDPNGLFWSGQGYTGTMLTHCRRIAQHQVQPADLVVFVNPREPAGHHVCQVLELAGDDMWLGSHGQESDPRRILLSQEAAGQAGMGATELHFLAVA